MRHTRGTTVVFSKRSGLYVDSKRIYYLYLVSDLFVNNDLLAIPSRINSLLFYSLFSGYCMSYRVPDSDIDSTTTFFSISSMSRANQSPEIVMGEPERQGGNLGLGADVIEELMQLLNERRARGHREAREQPVPYHRREAAMPKWSGTQLDFPFFISRLEARIETEYAPYFDNRSICLDMVDTLPEMYKSRVASWFEARRVAGEFDWKDFLEHFKITFADRQARQTASETVSRMEQGANQYFADFLQDFEHRLAQCDEVYTITGKTMQLKASINGKLRRALIGVKLPPVENYDEWVSEVREVALDLESLAD